jgi:hypothetical protein
MYATKRLLYSGHPPKAEKVQEVIDRWTAEGYTLKHIATGGFALPFAFAMQGTKGPDQFDGTLYSDNESRDYIVWVYLIFEKVS